MRVNTAAFESATCEQTVSHVLSAQHAQVPAVHAPVVQAWPAPQSVPPEAVQQPHWLYPVQSELAEHALQKSHAFTVFVPPLPASAQRFV